MVSIPGLRRSEGQRYASPDTNLQVSFANVAIMEVVHAYNKALASKDREY